MERWRGAAVRMRGKWTRASATYRSFIANGTLDHVLVDLALHRDAVLTHPAGDGGGAATLWGGQGGVGRGILPQQHRGLGCTWKRRETCTSWETGKGQTNKQTHKKKQSGIITRGKWINCCEKPVVKRNTMGLRREHALIPMTRQPLMLRLTT